MRHAIASLLDECKTKLAFIKKVDGEMEGDDRDDQRVAQAVVDLMSAAKLLGTAHAWLREIRDDIQAGKKFADDLKG